MQRLSLAVVMVLWCAQAFGAPPTVDGVGSQPCFTPNSNYTPPDVHPYHLQGSCDPAAGAVNVYDAKTSLPLPQGQSPLASTPCSPSGTWSIDVDTSPVKAVYATAPFFTSPDITGKTALRRALQVVQGIWPWSPKALWAPKACYVSKPVEYLVSYHDGFGYPGSCLWDQASSLRFWNFIGRCMPGTYVLIANDAGGRFVPCDDSGAFTSLPIVSQYAPWIAGHFEALPMAPTGAEVPPADPSYSLASSSFASPCAPANFTLPPSPAGLPLTPLNLQFPAH